MSKRMNERIDKKKITKYYKLNLYNQFNIKILIVINIVSISAAIIQGKISTKLSIIEINLYNTITLLSNLRF